MPGTFQTSSTEPAGMSFQQVSSPDTVSIGPGHLAVQVPAMREDAPSLEVPQNTGSEGHHHIERKILGVTILPRPRPPAEEECCMSGCVHCVYTVYADELEAYSAALTSARAALVSDGIAEAEWPEEVRALDIKGGPGLVESEKRKMVDAMDPSMAAFLALEGRLKKKQAPESSAAT
ncbi:MAG: hypothetical protein TREMPRED_005781 [Tremellales sp. Tagirdzhanova-0007]|nr:MAG: hypothetical protein TREMPRED_005781 [Tremellales sp. Tagirdzhanova-0007]